MCKERIFGSEDMQQDLAYMAGEWRDTVVQEIGRERYDELSQQLGGDLAYAYMDYRVEQLMIDKLVKDHMPKSSADYIIRKAGQSSLLGLSQTLSRSPLAEEIEKRGEAAYRPTRIEKSAGWLLGASADTVMLGGVGSWGTFAGSSVRTQLSRPSPPISGRKSLTCSRSKRVSAKACLATNVTCSTTSVRKPPMIPIGENTLIATANGQLQRKIPVVTFDFMDWIKKGGSGMPFWKDYTEEERERTEKYKDVPLIVAPGQEEAYLQGIAKCKNKADGQAETKTETEEKTEKEVQSVSPIVEKMQEEQTRPETQSVQGNGDSWDRLVHSLGLDGIGNVTGNLGYILAMLPDILLGVFTGKTQSLGLKDNLLPIASIVAGMFIKNPLLKMLLIGLGGANLLNKVGHEALGRGQTEGNRADASKMCSTDAILTNRSIRAS